MARPVAIFVSWGPMRDISESSQGASIALPAGDRAARTLLGRTIDSLVARCAGLGRRQFIAIFFTICLGAGVPLAVLAWRIVAPDVPWRTVVFVAIPVVFLVALPILAFIAEILERLAATEQRLRLALEEQYSARAELKRRTDLSARLGRLMSASSDEIYFFAVETLRFAHVNDGARRNLGYAQDELSALTPLDLMPDHTEAGFRELTAPLMQGAESMLVFETRHRRKDGSFYPVEVHLQHAPTESPPLFIATIRDITEQVRALEELRRERENAESANRAKSEFLANMSHELRTPLNAIIGFADLIRMAPFGPLGDSRYADYVDDIRDSGQHLSGLIGEILDLAKIEAGEITLDENRVDVARVVEACLRMVEQRAGSRDVALVSAFDGAALPFLRADSMRLTQILANLLSNAVKFTPAGGSVTVGITVDRADGFVLTVTDTGIGIAPEDIPKALSRFGQVDGKLNRKFEGTGLGLPLAQSLVALHGGTLTLESAVGIGTTVTVHVPSDRIVAREETASVA